MQTFEVTDPQSGVTLELTGESAPTETELEEIFASQAGAQTAPLSLPEFGTIDGNSALFGSQFGDESTGMGQMVRDGFAGLFTLNPKARIDGIKERFPELQIEPFEDGANAVITNPVTGGRAVVNAGGFSNQDVAPIIGTALAAIPAGKLAQGASTVGKAIMTGAAAEGATDLALQGGEILQGSEQGIDPSRSTIAAAAGGVGGGIIKGIDSFRTNSAALKKVLETDPDSTVAKYTLNGAGKVVKDKKAVEAIKQGFDEGVVSTIKGASKADKSQMLKMVNIQEKGLKNPKYAAINRPSDIVGESLMKRFNTVLKSNRQAGKKLDGVAKGLRGQKVDVAAPVDEFIADLEGMGVGFEDLKPIYQNSDIEGLAGPQAIFNRVIGRMKNTRNPDAFDVHRMKRYLDQQVSYGKTAEGLTGRAETVLKNLRRNLDSVLDSNFDEYDKVNTVYSNTRGALDDFQSAAGSKVDLTSANASKQIGTLSRRVLSNAQSRVQVLDAMKQIQDVAVNQGGKFDDDLLSQVVFVDDLQKSFGASARTSLAGEVEKGVKQAGQMRNSQGATEAVISLAGSVLEKMRGINQDGAFKAIRELLAQ